MALLQTNKDLIATGMKEFNILLNQQVSLVLCFRGQAWSVGRWVRTEKGE